MDNQTINSNFIQNTSDSTNFKDFVIFILIIAFVLSILGINIFVYLWQFIKFVASLFVPLFSSLGYATGTVLNTTTDLATDTTKFGIDVAGGTIHDIGNLMISASDKNAIPDFKQEYNKYSASLLDGISKAIATNPAKIQKSSPSPIMPPPTMPQQSSSPSMPQQSPSPSPVMIPVPVPVPVTVPTPSKSIQNTIDTPPPKYMNNVSADESNSIIQSQTKTNWCLVGEYKDRRGCVEVEDSDRCISGQIFPSQQQCMQPVFM